MGVAVIRVGFEGCSEDLASPLQLLRVGRVGGPCLQLSWALGPPHLCPVRGRVESKSCLSSSVASEGPCQIPSEIRDEASGWRPFRGRVYVVHQCPGPLPSLQG